MILLPFSSVAQLCLTLCSLMDFSKPGFPVRHQFLELAQTHVHWVSSTISPSVAPFSSCPQSFPVSGSFLMSLLFTSGGQNITTSASASVLPMNVQGWFPLGLTDLISLQSNGFSRVFSSTTAQKYLQLSIFFMVQPSHLYMTTGKNKLPWWLRW